MVAAVIIINVPLGGTFVNKKKTKNWLICQWWIKY